MSTLCSPLQLKLPTGALLEIGYRSPQLSDELDARGKMALAQELGMSVIEPQCNKREIVTITHARELGHIAQEEGIRIPSFGCDVPLLTESGQACQERVDFAVEVAEALGAQHFFTRILLYDEQQTQGDAWRQLADVLPVVVEQVAASGCVMGIEADGGTFVPTTERMLRVLALTDSPALVANFDACNLYMGGSDPFASLPLLKDRIRNGHIKDGIWHKRQHAEVAIGTGELNWTELFQAMSDQGCAVPMFIEHCKAAAEVRLAAAHLRSCLDRLGQV